MDVDPPILGHVANCIERNSNLLEIIRHVNRSLVSTNLLESHTTPPWNAPRNNPNVPSPNIEIQIVGKTNLMKMV